MFRNITLKIALFAAAFAFGSEAQAVSPKSKRVIAATASAIVGAAAGLAGIRSLYGANNRYIGKKTNEILNRMNIKSDFSRILVAVVAPAVLVGTLSGIAGYFATKAWQDRASNKAALTTAEVVVLTENTSTPAQEVFTTPEAIAEQA